jgi:phosphate transport system substrate-binding protein
VPRRKIAAGLVLAASLFAATQTSAQAYTAAQVDTSVQLTGAGATFPLNIIEQWKADFKKSSGVTVNYTGVGSGAGRTQLLNGTVDFAGSDVTAPAAQVDQLNAKYPGGFVYVPETAGAIAITYRLPGVPNGIHLTPADVANIFAGKVAYWDDKSIKDDNPKVKFPHTPIQVYVRSDSSGTSGNFTAYLTAAAGSAWKYGNTQQFPTDNGQLGVSGSDRVASAVKASTGGIGYTETSFAKERGLYTAKVRNNAGDWVWPVEANASKTVDVSKVNADGSVTMAFTTKVRNAYPISAVTYLMIPKRIEAKKLANLRAFVDYVLGTGQKAAPKLSYVQLPANMVKAAKAQMAKVTAK